MFDWSCLVSVKAFACFVFLTGEKPYQCSKCNAKFSDISSKGRHEKEHANNKRFTCSLCNDTFKRSGQLRSHLARKHSQSMAFKLSKDSEGVPIAFKISSDVEVTPVSMSRERIVSLIKSLASKTTPTQGGLDVENISLLEADGNDNQSTEIAMETVHAGTSVIDIGQLDKEVSSIELQGVEIHGTDGQQTYVTITDLAESLSNTNTDTQQVRKALFFLGVLFQFQQRLHEF